MGGQSSKMRAGGRSWVWLWASLAVIVGIVILVAVDLIEDPDSTLFDIALNLVEEAPLVLITVGIVILYQTIRRQRAENHRDVGGTGLLGRDRHPDRSRLQRR